MHWVASVSCLAALPLALYGTAQGARQAPEGDPDHIVLVGSERVVAVYSPSIRARNGHAREAWLRVDYPVPPEAPSDAIRKRSFILGLFDCAQHRWRAEVRHLYAPARQLPETHSFAEATSWEAVSERPAAAAALRYVCSYSGPAREPGETIYLM